VPFKSCRPSGSPRPIVNGTYFLISVANRNFCLDDATENTQKIQTLFCNGADSQKFNFSRLDAANGYAVQVLGTGQGQHAFYLLGGYDEDTFSTDLLAVPVGLAPLPSSPDFLRWDVQAVRQSRPWFTHGTSLTESTTGFATLRLKCQDLRLICRDRD
jgi:hypothetical protein